MHKFMAVNLIFLLVLFSGCSSGKKQKAPEGGFMQNDPARTQPSKSYFEREREKRREYDREFKDTRRPINQDHFQVMPWGGKHYSPRSEKLHDSSREPDSSLYYRF